MSDEFYKNIGFQQTPSGVSSYQPMGTPELLFRTVAGASPFVARAFDRRYPTIASSIAGIGTGLAGAFSGTLADELARQRMDPMAQQLRIAGQLQQLGTKPLGPPTLGPETTFSMPPQLEGESAIPAAPLAATPGTPGAHTFDIGNIPLQQRIAFSKELAPLQQAEAAKIQIALNKAQLREIEGLPTPEAAAASVAAKVPGLPQGIDITQKTVGGAVSYKSPSEVEKQRQRIESLNTQFANDVATEMEKTGKPRMEAANNILERKPSTYAELSEGNSPLVKTAHEWRTQQQQQVNQEAILQRQLQGQAAIAERQLRGQAVITQRQIEAENRRLLTNPLPVQYTGEFFKYDPKAGQLEPAPGTSSLQDIREGGYKRLTPKQLEDIASFDTANADLQMIKALSNQMKGVSAVTLQAGKLTGQGLGAQYDAARTRFGPIFDRQIGGVRAAASVPFANMIGRTLPTFYDSAEVIDFKNNMTQILLDSLKDEKVRGAFGMPVNQERLKQVKDLGDKLIEMEKKQSKPPSLPKSLPGAVTPSGLPSPAPGTPAAMSDEELLKALNK